MKSLTLMAALLVSGCCNAQDEPARDPYLDYAIAGQAADAVSTVIALAAGGTEMNPAGPAILLVKYPLVQWAASEQDAAVRKTKLKMVGSIGWAPVLGNLIGVPTIGAALGLALLTGIIVHNSVDLETPHD